ncbi:GAF and ANTAR domain-containing protein [Actinophytocola oryzae]|uniref:GAF and ANTAR domain-containing protein n=1 Tax=Actinophytocola oryzae TaxID=502181 RepID=UPI001FBBE335|nr:GAF and ANTAR domain-containing protein [Actinophytocola oryzae]
MDGERHQRLLRLLAERAHGERPAWARLVCEVAVTHLGVDGAAISLRTSGRAQELVADTGTWARGLEELQYTLGEGPAVEAFGTAGPVLVSDLSDAGARWPGFVDSAGAHGLCAVFALPIQGGAVRLGTLCLYRRRPRGLSPEELGDAAVLSDLATSALLTDVKANTASWTQAELPGHYDDVNIATGMLAAELRISIADAFLRLRAHAFGTGSPLLEVARAVLTRQLGAHAFQE